VQKKKKDSKREVRKETPTTNQGGADADETADTDPRARHTLPLFGMGCVRVHGPPAPKLNKKSWRPGAGSWSGHVWAQYIKLPRESLRRFSSSEHVNSGA